MLTFKTFSNKANAQRKAKQLGVEAIQVDGAWGVMLTTQTKTLPLVKQESPWKATDLDYSQPVKKEAVKVPSFAGFGVIPTGKKVNVEKVKAPKPENKTGHKVQKNRETRNNVTRPSVGTLCGDVWAAMDIETGAPNAETAKRLAAEHNWNVNNALIEVYRWKKFHA